MRTTDKTRTYRGTELSLESPELLEYARYELSRNRQIHLRMSGTSMKPTIDEGDVVTIAAVDPTSLKSRDIILCVTSSGTVMIHRVMSLQTRENVLYAITRADQSQYHDIPVPITQVIGRAVAVQRKGRGKLIPIRRSPNLLSRLQAWLQRLFGQER
jgi:signal peptidase I